MKVYTFLGHPAILVASFCLIFISGEHIGGPFLLYLLLGLPSGILHSLLGIAGILVTGYHHHLKGSMKHLHTMLAFLGPVLMVASLFSFFASDKSGYNNDTFYQTLPILSFVIFGIILCCYLTLKFKRLQTLKSVM